MKQAARRHYVAPTLSDDLLAIRARLATRPTLWRRVLAWLDRPASLTDWS